MIRSFVSSSNFEYNYRSLFFQNDRKSGAQVLLFAFVDYNDKKLSRQIEPFLTMNSSNTLSLLLVELDGNNKRYNLIHGGTMHNSSRDVRGELSTQE